jgi:4-amino-4-deoxy-L-arabinose transferase-like glycosyltransferase
LALLSALRFKGTNKAPRGIAAFGLLWFVTIFLFLSIVRFKRADYLLPAYPGLAIFVGCWLAKKVPGTFSSKACAGVALVVAIPWIGYHGGHAPRKATLLPMPPNASANKRRCP